MLKHDRVYSACEFRRMYVIMKCTIIQYYQGWHVDIILQQIRQYNLENDKVVLIMHERVEFVLG